MNVTLGGPPDVRCDDHHTLIDCGAVLKIAGICSPERVHQFNGLLQLEALAPTRARASGYAYPVDKRGRTAAINAALAGFGLA